MTVVITRTAWTDDDGTGTTGTVINNAAKTSLYDQIDALFAGTSAFYLGGALGMGVYTTTSTGTKNDWDIDTDNSGTTVGILRCNNASALTITGIKAPSAGRWLLITSVNAAVTIRHQNTSSTTAADRIITSTGGDLVLPAGTGQALAWYDGSTARWRVIAQSADSLPAGDNAICDVRLTLTSGTPVTTADVTGATSAYITPYKGNRIALYDGSALWSILTFSELTQALGTVVPFQAYDVFAYNNSGVVATEILEWANATITMTIAAPGVVTWTAHGMSTGMSITFTNSGGALPTGVTANTQYFITVVDANSFKLSTTLENVAAGTFITTTGSQSGTHTGHQPQTRATALTLQDGVLVKTGSTTRRFLGTFIATTTTATEDSAARRFLSNFYNRVPRPMAVVDTTNTWNYTTATARHADGLQANQLAFAICWPEIHVEAAAVGIVRNTLANVDVFTGIGADSTALPTADYLQAYFPTAVAGQNQPQLAVYRKQPTVGYHALIWLEYSAASGTTTWSGDAGVAAGIQAGIVGTLQG